MANMIFNIKQLLISNWANIYAGIISGICASTIVFLFQFFYHKFKSKYYNRSLKNVVQLLDSSPGIVYSTFLDEKRKELLHYNEAYSIGQLIETINYLSPNANINCIPHIKIIKEISYKNIFCVGGPVSNNLSREYLKSYCNKFEIHVNRKMNHETYEPIFVANKEDVGVKLGEEFINIDEESEDVAFLVKLSPKTLNSDKVVHILFGWTAKGGPSAVHYLNKYHKELYKKFKDNDYFISIKIKSNLFSYKDIGKDFQDHTDTMLKSYQKTINHR
jgi:hypothetical protein